MTYLMVSNSQEKQLFHLVGCSSIRQTAGWGATNRRVQTWHRCEACKNEGSAWTMPAGGTPACANTRPLCCCHDLLSSGKARRSHVTACDQHVSGGDGLRKRIWSAMGLDTTFMCVIGIMSHKLMIFYISVTPLVGCDVWLF